MSRCFHRPRSLPGSTLFPYTTLFRSSADFQALMQMVEGRADSHMIQTAMLRSLRPAVYPVENEGHFGLRVDAYAHFTSPLRRYPTLLVHRAVRSIIRSDEPSPQVT